MAVQCLIRFGCEVMMIGMSAEVDQDETAGEFIRLPTVVGTDPLVFTACQSVMFDVIGISVKKIRNQPLE